MKKKIVALLMSVVMMSGTMTNLNIKADTATTGDRLEYNGIKYKTEIQADKSENFSDTRKGLLLQSYGSNSTAKFKETYTGDFEIEMKALAEEKTPALIEYTLRFKSVTTQEEFALGIKDTGTATSAYVIVDEEYAGVNYANDSDGKAHGFTTSENSAGSYTKINGANTTTISFDPETLEVKIKDQSNGGEYKTIWCLTKNIMDGRRFDHTLEPFDYYDVSIEFTQVKTGSLAKLLIYNVNGEDYGEANLTEVSPKINSNIIYQGIVGKKYTLPEAKVYGSEESETIFCNVKNASGKQLTSGKLSDNISFTPDKEGKYYLYYYTEAQKNSGTYVILNAYKASDIECTIKECEPLTESVGANTTLTIPARYAESNIYFEGKKVYTDVVITKDGSNLEEKTTVTEAFDYTFKETGKYTITWKTSLYGKEYKEKMTVKVDEKIPGIVGAKLEKVYDKDFELEIPEAKVYLNNNEYITEAKVIKPSNNTVTDKKIKLDELGLYTVVYSYDADGKNKSFKKTFQVEYGSENVFIAGEDTEVYYDNVSGNADMPGVQVEMTSKNSSVTYAKTIDLSDNTKLDKLIELYLIPQTTGTRDMSGFYITLTDKLNPDNQVSIRVIAGEGNMSSGSFVRVKATGQDGYLGLYKNHSWDSEPYTWTEEIEAVAAHDKGGYTTDLDFAFNNTSYDMQDKTLILRYDAKEKAIYGHQKVKLVHDKDYREELITDLDDTSLYKTAWQGFTDDSQVELSITPVSVSGKATFKIMSVDGQDLSNKVLADTTAPDVTVDYKGMDKAPTGKVGMAYPIFDIIATDDLCSDESLIKKITVKHDGKEIEVKDNSFVPKTEGVYQIQYTVSDGFGNTSKKNVNVTVKNNVEKVKMTLKENFSDTIAYGMNYYAPEFEGKGGSGKLTYRTYYVHNGEETEFTNCFKPMDEGEYTVVCEVKDYIGQTVKEEKTLNVVFKPEILFEDSDIVLPQAIAAEKTYKFEKYQAEYYEKIGDDPKNVTCKIEVTDAESTRTLEDDRLYIAKMSKQVSETNIKFIFEAKANGETISKEITRKVKLLNVSTDNQFVTSYFIKEGASLKALNRYMIISANANKTAKVSYINAVQAEEFSMIFKADQADNGSFNSSFDKLRVTLTDKNNPDEVVKIEISKDGKGLKNSINGKKGVTIPGSLTAESADNIEIGYNNEDYTVTAAGNATVGTIDTYLNGTEFKGFSSDEIYVDIELVNAKKGSAIDMISMNNQTFIGVVQDTIDPQLFVKGSYSGMFTEGTKIKLPKANAYDVLSAVLDPTITVSDKDGKAVKTTNGIELKDAVADKEYEIKLDKIGVYTVTYSAEDAAGRKVSVSKNIEIIDDVLPTLELKGKYSESVSAGKTVKVKKYKISDNGNTDNVKVTVYYGSPNGILEKVKDGKIETKEKGLYTVYYFMTDENGNRNVATFTFEAK